MNPSYYKPSPAASIGWGGFFSATWGTCEAQIPVFYTVMKC
ncbi:MAG: hypothetical protein ACYC6R_00935 [Anaerolineales bacterium]